MYLYAWSRLCINLVAKIKFRHLAVMIAKFKITCMYIVSDPLPFFWFFFPKQGFILLSFQLQSHWLLMGVQNHMNFHSLMISIPWRNLNLHWFCRNLLIMVCKWHLVILPIYTILSLFCSEHDITPIGLSLLVIGGVLFKVYIVGEAIKVVRRFSLPDVTKQDLSTSAGVFRFPRVSCAAASADDADLDPCVAGE